MGNQASNFPYQTGQDVHSYAGSIWKLAEGKKAGTDEDVSIFSFDKIKQPDLVPAAKNALHRLRTLRHPHILKFIDGVELPNNIFIVTEPVVPLVFDGRGAASPSALLQTSLGLYQITSAVSFLMDKCNVAHGNLCPSSLFATKAGDWKLGGFELCSGDPSPFRQLLPVPFRPPEFSKSSSVVGLDNWSLGCVLYSAFNGEVERPSQLTQPGRIDAALLPDYKRLLATDPAKRLNPAQLLHNDFFDNELVKSVTFLDEIAIKNSHEKEQFFVHFATQVNSFPESVSKYKLLPQLLQALEFGSGGNLFNAVLCAVLDVAAKLNNDEFAAQVTPVIVRLFASNERAVRLFLLQRLDRYCERLSAPLVNDKILPQIATGFSDSNAALREATVKSLTLLAPKISESNMNNKVLPRLSALQADPEPAIRTNTTYCLAKIAPHLTFPSFEKFVLMAFIRALKDGFVPARCAGLVGISACIERIPPAQCGQYVLPGLAPLTCAPTFEVRDAAVRALTAVTAKLQKFHQEETQKQQAQAAQANVNGNGIGRNGANGATAAQNTNSASASASSLAANASGVLGSLGSWAVTSISKKIYAPEDGQITSPPASSVSSSKPVSSHSARPALPSTPSTPSAPVPSASAAPRSTTSQTAKQAAGDGWSSDAFFDDLADWNDAKNDDDTQPITLSLSTAKPKKAGRALPGSKPSRANGSSSATNLLPASSIPATSTSSALSGLGDWDSWGDDSSDQKASSSIGGTHEMSSDWGSLADPLADLSISLSGSMKMDSGAASDPFADLASGFGTSPASAKKPVASSASRLTSTPTTAGPKRTSTARPAVSAMPLKGTDDFFADF